MYTTETVMVPGENQTKKIGGKVEQKRSIKKITAKYKSKKYLSLNCALDNATF